MENDSLDIPHTPLRHRVGPGPAVCASAPGPGGGFSEESSTARAAPLMRSEEVHTYVKPGGTHSVTSSTSFTTGIATRSRPPDRQGLTLVHFSAHLADALCH